MLAVVTFAAGAAPQGSDDRPRQPAAWDRLLALIAMEPVRGVIKHEPRLF